jgi:hypothetical protein
MSALSIGVDREGFGVMMPAPHLEERGAWMQGRAVSAATAVDADAR